MEFSIKDKRYRLFKDNNFFVDPNGLETIKNITFTKLYDGTQAGSAWPTDKIATDDLDNVSVFTQIFGNKFDAQTYTLTGTNIGLDNACASRLSLALGKLDIDLPFKDFYGQNGNMKDKSVITRASRALKLMYKNMPKGSHHVLKGNNSNPITLSRVKKAFKGKKGIYIMIPKDAQVFGATGHVGLWKGDKVLGEHNYVDSFTKEVHLFQIKEK